jgi:hypothetical protein
VRWRQHDASLTLVVIPGSSHQPRYRLAQDTLYGSGNDRSKGQK